MHYKNLILLTTIVNIAACASNNTPTAPEERRPGSYTAVFLPVMADKWNGGIVQLAVKDKNGCGHLENNILPNLIDDDYIVDIEGDRDIFFHISQSNAQTACTKNGMFFAIRGNTYTFKFEIKNNQCEFSLLEKSPNGVQNTINSYPSHVSKVDGVRVCENKYKLY